MSNTGQPTVSVSIYTCAGWIHGMIHVEPGRTLLTELNDGGSFFRLTDARLPLEEETRDFFAVHARVATIVLPLDVRDQYGPILVPNGTVRHEVSCLLSEGTLICAIDVLEGCRVSDHLLNRDGFIPIRESRLPFMELPPGVIEPIPIAYLNTSRIIGIAETHPMKADPSAEELLSNFSEV